MAGAIANKQSENSNSDMEKMLAEEIPVAPTSDGLARRGETPGTSEKVHMAIVIVSCIFIAFQITGSLGTGAVLNAAEVIQQEQQRLSVESCVQKFWEIAEVLQQDRLPDDSHNCLGSNLPNVITRSGDDVIVSHPQPQLLGYSEIVVSKNNPVPELIR